MEAKPFWEQTYANKDVSTFQKDPTTDRRKNKELVKVSSQLSQPSLPSF